jgi:hypothetical protein
MKSMLMCSLLVLMSGPGKLLVKSIGAGYAIVTTINLQLQE